MRKNEDRSALVVITSEVQSPQVPASDITPNRESIQLIAASSDAELGAAYLDRGGLSAKSVKNTGKELQRFLLWCQQSSITLRGLLRASEGTVSNAVKGALEAAARLADSNGDEETGASLRRASTHWLRHSVFTHLANNGVPLTTVQATAGHAKLSRTLVSA